MIAQWDSYYFCVKSFRSPKRKPKAQKPRQPAAAAAKVPVPQRDKEEIDATNRYLAQHTVSR